MSVIMFLGPPGAGKGEQCARLEASGWQILSTGQLLRQAAALQDARGLQIRDYLNRGALVPDEWVVDLVRDRVSASPGVRWILDGFPRTEAQASLLGALHLLPQHVFVLVAPDDLIVARLGGRMIDLESGRVYHDLYHPPKHAGVDDESGRPLVRRDDDRPEVIRARLALYHAHTAPMLDFFERVQGAYPLGLTYLDATDRIEHVYACVSAVLAS